MSDELQKEEQSKDNGQKPSGSLPQNNDAVIESTNIEDDAAQGGNQAALGSLSGDPIPAPPPPPEHLLSRVNPDGTIYAPTTPNPWGNLPSSPQPTRPEGAFPSNVTPVLPDTIRAVSPPIGDLPVYPQEEALPIPPPPPSEALAPLEKTQVTPPSIFSPERSVKQPKRYSKRGFLKLAGITAGTVLAEGAARRTGIFDRLFGKKQKEAMERERETEIPLTDMETLKQLNRQEHVRPLQLEYGTLHPHTIRNEADQKKADQDRLIWNAQFYNMGHEIRVQNTFPNPEQISPVEADIQHPMRLIFYPVTDYDRPEQSVQIPTDLEVFQTFEPNGSEEGRIYKNCMSIGIGFAVLHPELGVQPRNLAGFIPEDPHNPMLRKLREAALANDFHGTNVIAVTGKWVARKRSWINGERADKGTMDFGFMITGIVEAASPVAVDNQSVSRHDEIEKIQQPLNNSGTKHMFEE